MPVEVFIQLFQTSPLLMAVYASMRGLIIWKTSHDQIISGLQAQIADLKQGLKDEQARTVAAERNTVEMRNMLFESLGINKTVIAKLPVDGQATAPNVT